MHGRMIRQGCAIAVLAGTSTAFATTIGYWRFDEGPADSAAGGAAGSVLESTIHHLNLTPFGQPVYRSDRPITPIPQTGAANKLSLEINAATQGGDGTQRLGLADSPLLELTHSLTVEAYVNVFSLPQGANGESQIVFRGDDRGGLDPYFLELHGNDVRFEINSPDGQGASVSAALPVVHQWVHLAGTLNDATGQMRLYINGTPAATTTTNLRPLGALDPTKNPGLGIGNVQSANTSEYFHGMIDEVRLSDRPLTPQEFLMSPLLPDANGNGTVDFGDLLSLAQHYGMQDVGFEQGDFNSDAKVDFSDLLTLAQHYGDRATTGAALAAARAAAVPEPAGGLITAGALGCIMRRRRRGQ